MPETGTDTKVVKIPLAKRGLNLYSNILDLHPEECLYSMNMFYRNGMVVRNGMSLYDATEVQASKKIVGLHRMYYGSNRKTLAACKQSIQYWKDITDNWEPIDATVGQSQTDSTQTYMSDWGMKSACYIGNGVNTPIKYDGTTATTMTHSAIDGSTKALMFLPYQDRLLAIVGGDLTWSHSYDDTQWYLPAQVGVRPDTKLYGMTYHSKTNVDAGYETSILLAGTSRMYIFSATSLSPTVGDYTIYTLPIEVGCNAPRTMCWTPIGTLWLGTNKMVYLLPFNSLSPVPVGTKIWSTGNTIGLESIPQAQVANACAVYHNGFYKISFAGAGASTNTFQYWLDINRFYQDENKLYGPWYGPMQGKYDSANTQYAHSFSCFAKMNGAGDNGELLAGESNSKGYVYQIHDVGIYADKKTSDLSNIEINMEYKTPYNNITDDDYAVEVDKAEITLMNVTGTTNTDFYDIHKVLKQGDKVVNEGGVKWGTYNWGVANWSDNVPIRQVVDISPATKSRRLSQVLKSSTLSDKYELYDLKILCREQRLALEEV